MIKYQCDYEIWKVPAVSLDNPSGMFRSSSVA